MKKGQGQIIFLQWVTAVVVVMAVVVMVVMIMAVVVMVVVVMVVVVAVISSVNIKASYNMGVC